jgi:Adenylate kinase and related kinases
LGCSGSGKSTLSQKLSEHFKLPVIHLDRYYWKPNWTPTPNDEWDEFVIETANQEEWVIDGNYSRTLDHRLKRADAVVYLDMPRYLCIYGALKRRIQYHGKTRPDMNEKCPEKIDWAFFLWIWNYKKRSRSKVLNALDQAMDQKKIVILRTRKEVEKFTNGIKESGGF